MIGEGKDLKGKHDALYDFMYERIEPRRKSGEKRAISKGEADDWDRAHTTFEYIYKCLQGRTASSANCSRRSSGF